MATVKGLRNELGLHYKANEVIAYDIWTVEDVIERAHENGKEVTQEQAEEVLEFIQHHRDANLGITWIKIDCALDELGELPEYELPDEPDEQLPETICSDSTIAINKA
jgi:hypothetical protein